MNLVIIKGNRAELVRENGSLVNIITNDAISGQLNTKGDLIVITKTDGRVDLHRVNGSFIRNIANNARDARFNGNDIAVTRNDGKIDIRRENGSYIRTI
jgi:hypothetical protein